MGSRGGFKFDEIKAPDGSRIPIKLDKDRGTFSIEVEKGEVLEGTELEDVKRRAMDWLRENKALEWKAKISIDFEERMGFGTGHKIALEYHRGFVATDARGRLVVSTFNEKHTGKEDRRDEVEGEPGQRDSDWRFREGDNRTILDYTPERWSSLRLITIAIQSIDQKLRLFLSRETADATLAAIASTGVANLLGGPTSKKGGRK